MDSIFSECISLLSLPYISKWNTSKVNNKSKIFYNVRSLLSLPEIMEYFKVKKMSRMLYHCYSLKSLLDISK